MTCWTWCSVSTNQFSILVLPLLIARDRECAFEIVFPALRPNVFLRREFEFIQFAPIANTFDQVGVFAELATGPAERRPTMQTRYEPPTINDLQKCLDGCSDKMRVEVKGGVSLDVKTVADLRSLLVWSSSWAVVVPDERDRPEGIVVVEQKS